MTAGSAECSTSRTAYASRNAWMSGLEAVAGMDANGTITSHAVRIPDADLTDRLECTPIRARRLRFCKPRSQELFSPQRLHRIHPHRASPGNVAGCERRHGDADGHDTEQ